MMRAYRDRGDAGQQLADEVFSSDVIAALDHDQLGDVVLLALPRGGVPVAVPVARALGVPLAVLVVRKLGAPAQPELAIGAIAALGDQVVRVLNTEWIGRIGLAESELDRIVAAETRELDERVARFGAAPPVDARVVIIVDDGLATGATMRVAVTAVRSAGARTVVAAAPVGAVGACQQLGRQADLVICPRRPDPFRAVGEHYRDFAQVADAVVLELLGRA